MTPNQIDGLSQLSDSYDAIFSDVWGVLHNGRDAFPGAAHALRAFRESGGHVVLITNSPRPRDQVVMQLEQIGVDREAFDEIVTSGDVTRELIKNAPGPVYHLGPERDLHLYDGLNVELVEAAKANSFVCTGLIDDDTESPEDYIPMLTGFVDRDLPFICANPDIVVERGNRLVWCAGALAKLYEELGGTVEMAGKPHSPIYESAKGKLSALNCKAKENPRILAIGDGMPTDVKGAQTAGLDLLYIACGIHAEEYGGAHPQADQLIQFLDANQAKPIAWSPRLVW